jgi:hypothetical protein
VDGVEPTAEEGGDVLHEDVAGLKRANDAGDGCPQAAVDTGDAFAFAGVADVLVTPKSG